MVFSDGVLTNKNKSLSVYITELQEQTNEKRSEASLGLYSWLNASPGEKFRLEHIESLKRALEEPRLLAYFGYGTIPDILGRNWSALSERVNTHQKVASFAIINDLRTVADALTIPKFIIIADSAPPNSRIVSISDMQGTDWASYGGTGSGQGEFDFPNGVSYDKATSNIYTADSRNHRIVLSTITGENYAVLGGVQGSGTQEFNLPFGVFYDPVSDFIFIADTLNHRIIKSRINGSGWVSLGSEGSGVGQFNRPYGVWYDAVSDYVFVADRLNNRVVRSKMDGSGWLSTNEANGPTDVSYDADTELIYIAVEDAGYIVRKKIDGSSRSTTGGFHKPKGIYYDNTDGYIYIANGGGTGGDNIIRTFWGGGGWTEYGEFGHGQGQFSDTAGISL